MLGPPLAALTPAEERDARVEGQNRPLEAIVASALELVTEQATLMIIITAITGTDQS